MKKIAQSFYGRVQAYEDGAGLADPDALVEALRRNASPDEARPCSQPMSGGPQAGLATLDLEALLRQADALSRIGSRWREARSA